MKILFFANAVILIFASIFANTHAQVFTMSLASIPSSFQGVDSAVDENFLYVLGLASSGFSADTVSGTGITIMKYSLNATRLWTRQYTAYYAARIVLFHGDVIAVGFQISAGASVALRYSANGTLIYAQTGDSNQPDVPIDCSLSEPFLFVSGTVNVANIATKVLHLANGTVASMWNFQISGQAAGIAAASIVGEFFLTGQTTNAIDGQPLIGNGDIFLIRANLFNQTRLWTRIYGSSKEDSGFSVTYDPASQLIFVVGNTGDKDGTMSQFNGGKSDVSVFCTNLNGASMWIQTFGSGQDDQAFRVKLHPITKMLFIVGSMNGAYSGNNLASTNGFVSVFSQTGANVAIVFGNAIGAANVFTSVTISTNGRQGYVLDKYTNAKMAILSISLPVVTTTFVATLVETPSTAILITGAAPFATLTVDPAQTVPNSLMPAQTSIFIQPSSSAEATSSDSASVSASDQVATATPTVAPDQDVTSNGARTPVKLTSVIYIAAGAAVFLAIVGIMLWIASRPKKAVMKKSLDMAEFENSTAMINPATTMMTSMSSSGNTTLLRTDTELALPGFLAVSFKKDIRLGREIARGGGGVVCIATSNLPSLNIYGREYVVKMIKTGQGVKLDSLSEAEQLVFKQEASIMHYFRENKHFAKLLGWCDDPACLALKFYRLGSLDNWTHSSGVVRTRALQVSFMHDICKAVMAMHDSGFVHCDLKPPNILLDMDGNGQPFCVLTDFGITQIVGEQALLVKSFSVMNARGMSFCYAAPETLIFFLSNGVVDQISGTDLKNIDMYSLGIIIEEVLTRVPPWSFRQ